MKVAESHGFTTKKGWMDFFEEYNQMVYEINQSSYELMTEEYSFDAWMEAYHQISDRMKAEYQKSQELLKTHVQYFLDSPEKWTREIAGPLLDCLFRYVTRIQDIGCLFNLTESLSRFYEGLDDEKALMKCHMIRAFCYNYLDSIHMSEKIYSECNMALEYYEPHFLELTPEEQSMGLSIYDVMFDDLRNHFRLDRPLQRVHIEEAERIYEASSKAAAHVRATDQGYEFNQVIPSFDFYFAVHMACLDQGCLSEREIAMVRAAALAMREEPVRDETEAGVRVIRDTVCGMMADRLDGRCTDGQIISYLRQVMEILPGEVFDDAYNQSFIDTVESIYLCMDSLKRQGAGDVKLYRSVAQMYANYMTTRPYISFLDHICNSCCYYFIMNSISCLGDGENILHSLLDLAVLRHVNIAVHSIMCGKLGRSIMKHIISDRPELLTGQLSCETVEDVVSRSEEFCRFIYMGALLHDVGKMMCSTVINTQYRRLSDVEFEAIRYHPVSGGEILGHIPALSAYKDLALGHHKSYSGARGYPPEFDNHSSKVRIFTEIIQICDSLDAATDQFGRNYARAKDFETVLEEFKSGRNTDYNGELVDLLDGNQELQREIKEILGQGRRETQYEVHKMIYSNRLRLETGNSGQWMYRLQ